ncbi:cold shock domain-containing protein [Acinetobacter sp. S40]|uniref:cold shock domain-containing protein n=1 Tax=unclassified Acinetobacter TaxID=196816 RepID=UPI00190DFC9A|nr:MULTISPECIES: cold shock domain-containing protein [unclassified Acinetobacter]MBJ9986392.1 cold shock domain-containing protein [Acinetobacter sp. S40]MBK0063666.1 cold shock domain-containing protein [Acinetobacter sp. S55]MBK0067544.1 cold shock domain-containing protein [Acinetobacter sp. S54]
MKSEFYQGKVKQYDAKKGFGFIGALDQDIFFHISDFPLEDGEPKRNERVKFKVIENNGKYRAVKIERVIDQSTKAKKSRAVENNQSITNALLGSFRK